MDDKLSHKLRRLGVAKGARNLKPAPKPTLNWDLDSGKRPFPPPSTTSFEEGFDPPQPIDTLLPGIRREETAEGACYILDKVYPLNYQHGQDLLQALLTLSPAPAAVFTQDTRLESLNFRDFLFIDTETTGLAGAGTLAFMVGAAFFERGTAGDVFVVRQYFLRDHGDEPAMLLLLDELVAEKAGLITFNGRSFDIPLLDTRFLMNRMRSDIRQKPHIDLLPPARRLWRQRLGSCALGSLEETLLGLHRTHEDVPGFLIPSLYNAYLRHGDATALSRVFYHNQIDMVSMVTLASRVMRQFAHAAADDHPIDLYSLGKWQASLGDWTTSEQTLKQAVQGDLPLDTYHQALAELAALLKRQDRRAEAIPYWQQIAATSFDDISAHLELAMHYEWQEQDLAAAITWTERALALSQSWPPSRAALVQAELAHRLTRLQRKLTPS
ncbi:MAG: ribonuclease H-like domain-containing protein [Anaerolineae bacterium]|nr:ribonuclease H-like domain-containing protein [Anaerolineae bacterium]